MDSARQSAWHSDADASDRPGEIVRMSLLVGAFVTAAFVWSSARHSRAERKAQENVQRVLRDFLTQKR
jgi:hypothetical protein